jgi:hypothetical protein
MQDSMATPGNFGGGSAGPDRVFLGITRAPPSAPGRERAQGAGPWALCGETRTPRPQSTRQLRAALAVKVSYSSKAVGGLCQCG